MTPRKGHIIVKAYLEQKETHKVTRPDGSVVQLYIGRKFGENSREINPTVCEVISKADDIDQVDVGDIVIVHHNMVVNDAIRIEKNIDEQTVILTLFCNNLLYAKINKVTGELEPIYSNCIAERIMIKEQTNILTTFERKDDHKFKIVSTPKDFTRVKPGDNVLCYKYSDYEMVYHFNNIERRAIRIWGEDILGVFN